MPAVTVEDLTALPRIPASGIESVARPVAPLSSAPSGFEGEGFPVHRAFAGIDLALLDPFIMMDQMGEVEYAPGRTEGHFVAPTSRFRDRHIHDRRRLRPSGQQRWRWHDPERRHPVDDRRWGHPAHREAAGVAGAVGRLFHGIQLWVNLRGREMVAPRYQDLRGPQTVLLSSSDDGSLVRVIAGTIAGHDGPGSTYTPMTLVHATVADRPAGAAVAARLQRPGVRARWFGAVGPRVGRSGRAARGVRRRRHDHRCGRPLSRADHPRSRSSCSAAARSASPSHGAARSS